MGFTVNGFYYDFTSVEPVCSTPGVSLARIARELQDISFDVAMDNVQDLHGTGTMSQGANVGRYKVNSPSMTVTQEAFDEYLNSLGAKKNGFTLVLFGLKLVLKSAIDVPQSTIEVPECRIIGHGHSWAKDNDKLFVKLPMWWRYVLVNGACLARIK